VTQKQTNTVGRTANLLSVLLVLQILAGTLSRGTPSLHLVLEHGVWDRLAGFHLHIPFFGEGHGDRLSPHLHRQAASTADDTTRGDGETPAQHHEHHGLPDLLQGGMIDAAEPALALGAVFFEQFDAPETISNFLFVSHLELIRAPRPPPTALL